MKKFIKDKILYLIGGVVGGVAGYLYYYYVGCASGTCMITSSPVISTLWGAVMGGLLLSLFDRKKKE
ncbi:MAG: DUF6132 family protein [Alistipes sp.]